MMRSLVAITAAALASTPALAATYSAKPVSPVADSRIAARDLVWACGPGACVGSTSNSRPIVLCQGLAKKAGRLQSFSVDGRPISAAELDRCNRSAPAGDGQKLAKAR